MQKEEEFIKKSCTNSMMVVNGNINDINMGDIIDILMQNVGRFCEKNLEDFILTWKYLEKMAKQKVNKNTEDIICFAIRKLGVDSNSFLISRLENNCDGKGLAEIYYRKIFAVIINRQIDNSIICELHDITDTVSYEYNKTKNNTFYVKSSTR